MIDRRTSGTAWLFAKASLFTLVVPGTVVVLVPYLLLADAALGAVDVQGISMLGLLPLVLGAALYLRCAYDFVWSGRGTPVPIDPPVELVISGPYRYCRNPMYIGILGILGGEALLYRDLRLLLFLLAMAVLFNIFILGYEERALRRRFGEAYARYCEAVPRWIPGWAGLKALYRGTFLKVGVFVLAAGAVAHVVRLTVGLPVLQMPDSIHAFLVVLPAYAGFGCIVYARRINLAGVHHAVILALIIGLLVTTVVMHIYSMVAHDNRWLGVFPMWYSVAAVLVYGGFALFLKTRTM
ncbi:MAG: methyltransferase family protein [Planctomycetota bacterium]|jgi:protein-S-isoprenylcysteine O-methyltransferase Ste14